MDPQVPLSLVFAHSRCSGSARRVTGIRAWKAATARVASAFVLLSRQSQQCGPQTGHPSSLPECSKLLFLWNSLLFSLLSRLLLMLIWTKIHIKLELWALAMWFALHVWLAWLQEALNAGWDFGLVSDKSKQQLQLAHEHDEIMLRRSVSSSSPQWSSNSVLHSGFPLVLG